MNRKALVVLSGGQDSTTCLFWAKHEFDEVHAVTFDYGQRHALEIDAAEIVAKMAKTTSHEIVTTPNCLKSTSPLVSSTPLERYENYKQMDKTIGDRIEVTFVPMRNTLFLTIAANRAVALGCQHIVTGVCQQDNANYPDCRESFIESFQQTLNESLGSTNHSETYIHIHTPLMWLTKAQTVHFANGLPGCMEALAYSHTSYDGKYPPSDMNHSNVLRAQGFLEAGLPDPLVVRAALEGVMILPATPNYDIVRASI